MMRRRSDLPPADPQPWSEMVPADSFYAWDYNGLMDTFSL